MKMKFPKKIKFPKLKINTKKNIVIAILAILLLVSNFSLAVQFLRFLNPFTGYQNKIDELQKHAVLLEFDRVWLEDASNILLALQDYQFENGSFPATLETLRTEGYLDPNARLNDAYTHQPYYYLKRAEDFVLCIHLSDMVKGVNTASCPQDGIVPQESAPVSETKMQRLEITGDSVINVREEPTINSAIITRVNPGDMFPFKNSRNGWFEIVISKQKQGWVFGEFVKVLDNNQ